MSLAAMVLFTNQQPWATDALCAQTDPEAFYPEGGGSTREAKKVCMGCDVRSECLEYALRHDERFGVWGGFSERERRAITRGTVTVCPDCDAIFYHHGRYVLHQRAHQRARLERTIA